ncbi:carbonic anhydrase family protein [Crossiella cryophila]|uniref:carbonic anhydrase n=1 Tax=Crossiella cryophila TaxID=43355 RepID=A0A7W7CI67_9PSEU|nr:carbonic anhydrase family protein [Crossiella cryophila]MBB4681600.1 carbonic anhydrase [Crossiella cryophila]
MGDQQSPISLGGAVSAPGLRDRVRVEWAEGEQAFSVSKQEHGYRFAPAADNTVLLDGRAFRMVNVHFHRPVEHWLDGVPAGPHIAELHAVHVRAEQDLRVCAVAIFLDLGAEEPGVPVEVPPFAFDLAALLPPGRDFYRYEGSLTTPGYDETVSWVVYPEPVAVGDDRLRGFIRAHADSARAQQPRNRRFVLWSGECG